jgi:hypothetical protein
MNKYELKRLALLGMTAGIFMSNPVEIEAMQDDATIDLNYVLAKPKCKAHGGCGGLTASRDVNDASTADAEEEDDADGEEIEGQKENEKDGRQPIKTPKAKALV